MKLFEFGIVIILFYYFILFLWEIGIVIINIYGITSFHSWLLVHVNTDSWVSVTLEYVVLLLELEIDLYTFYVL